MVGKSDPHCEIKRAREIEDIYDLVLYNRGCESIYARDRNREAEA
jgi:hypothetical protein